MIQLFFILFILFIFLWIIKNSVTIAGKINYGAFISIKKLKKYVSEVSFWDTFIIIETEIFRKEYWQLYMGPITFAWFIFAYFGEKRKKKTNVPWRINNEKL